VGYRITLLFSKLAVFALGLIKFWLEPDSLEFEHVSGAKISISISTETEPKANRIDVAASQVAS
jgi:hypothetical protein